MIYAISFGSDLIFCCSLLFCWTESRKLLKLDQAIAIRAGFMKNLKYCRVGSAYRILPTTSGFCVRTAHPTCRSKICGGVLY